MANRHLILDAYASAQHYFDHLGGIWDALDPAVKGKVYAPKASCPWGEPLPPRWPVDRIVLVASYVDAVKVSPRRYCLVSHGADQAYPADPRTARNPSYAGGDGHDRCILFLCPSAASVAAWAARYPDTPAVHVGCILLDFWHRRGSGPGTFPTR